MLGRLYRIGTGFANSVKREARCLYNGAKDIANSAADKAAKEVQGLKIARLENKYGEQVGNISPNGNMGFKKQISCDEFLLTGIDKDGNVIAQVNRKIYAPFEQTTDKIRINENGKFIETRKSIRKSNYRNNFKNNIETGETERRILHVDPINKQATITVRKTDPHGVQTEETRIRDVI